MLFVETSIHVHHFPHVDKHYIIADIPMLCSKLSIQEIFYLTSRINLPLRNCIIIPYSHRDTLLLYLLSIENMDDGLMIEFVEMKSLLDGLTLVEEEKVIYVDTLLAGE